VAADSFPADAVLEDAVPDAVPAETVPEEEVELASEAVPVDDASPAVAAPLAVELALLVAPVLLDVAASACLSDDGF